MVPSANTIISSVNGASIASTFSSRRIRSFSMGLVGAKAKVPFPLKARATERPPTAERR
jgi:hypothetical protein